VPRLAYLLQAIREKLIDHKQYLAKYGEDMPEVRDWAWGSGLASKALACKKGERLTTSVDTQNRPLMDS
jgi:xylulose-5-phosphate/fructose-6-phosphate phosphoketolase